MSLDRLRQVAEDATNGDPEADDQFIATFDPLTVRALLDVAECARRAADEPWDGGIDAQPASSLTVAEMELREALARLREVG